MEAGKRGKTTLREVAVVVAYACLTALGTYPLVLEARTSVPFGGDAWQNLWNLWWVRRALTELHTSPYFTHDVFFPYGASLYLHTLNLLPSVVAIPISSTLGLAAAYNFLVLLAWVVSGYGAYRLSLYALRHEVAPANAVDENASSLAAFVAGTSFTFSAYHFAHVLGHLDLVSTQTLPFFVLFLLKTRDEERWINPVAAGLLFTLTFLTDAYYAMFLAVLMVLFAAHVVWTMREASLDFLRRLSVAVIALLISASPVLIPMLSAGHPTGPANIPYDVDRFSPDLLAFIVPSPLHPLWGTLAGRALSHLVRGDNGPEAIVFVGFVPLALSVLALRYEGVRRTFWPFAAVMFTWLALGPRAHIFGRTVNLIPRFVMPYTWLSLAPYGDIPRVPARFVVMTLLSMTPLAAIGTWRVFSRIGARCTAVAVALSGAILFENAVIPLPLVAASAPPFYQRLRDEAPGGGVLELPIPDDPGAYPRRMFYQTVHTKPLFEGYLARGFPPLPFEGIPGFWELKGALPSLDDVVAYNAAELDAAGRTVMNAYDVRHIVIDKHLVEPAEVERERQVIERLLDPAFPYEDTDVIAYTVTERRLDGPPVLWLDTGWSYLERLQGQDAMGRPPRWRWMGRVARLGVGAPAPIRARLRLAAQAFGADRQFSLTLGSTTIATLNVAWRDEAEYETPVLQIPGGISFLELKSLEAPGTGRGPDHRLLSMALHRVELIAEP